MIRFTMPVAACSPGVLNMVKALVESHPGDEQCVIVMVGESERYQWDVHQDVDGCLELVTSLENLGFAPEMIA